MRDILSAPVTETQRILILAGPSSAYATVYHVVKVLERPYDDEL